MQDLGKIAEQIVKLKSATIFTHIRPDGDTLGSGIALFFALQRLGIRAEICNAQEIPENFHFLEGTEGIVCKPTFEAEAYIAVDAANEERLGALGDLFAGGRRRKATFNIDHHVTNTRYAKENYVRECAANCLNMRELIRCMGVPVDRQIADALLMGILTDSGNFAHSDVNGEVLRVAAEMVDAGADINRLNYHLFKKQSRARAKLYGITMSGIRYFLDDRLAVICVTQEMLDGCGADRSMTEGFVDFPLTVDGVEVAVAMLEMRQGQYKISLRSKGKVNVNAVAAVYGGGGHVLASGCMLFGESEDVIDRLRYTVSQYMD